MQKTNCLPKHIGIIMDGNGRWAQLRGRQRVFGHLKGARVARQVVSDCVSRGIENLTLFAFSSENWLRPKEEVSFLMSLLERYIRKEKATLIKENIQFRVIGDSSQIPAKLAEMLKQTEIETAKNSGMKLLFAISYGARSEITRAMKEIAIQVANKEIDVDSIDEAFINNHLDTYPAPSLDLVIRTSGEYRLSNFLLWQAAYAELYFDQTLWPDFDSEKLDQALDWYSRRQRRFGAISKHEHAFG